MLKGVTVIFKGERRNGEEYSDSVEVSKEEWETLLRMLRESVKPESDPEDTGPCLSNEGIEEQKRRVAVLTLMDY